MNARLIAAAISVLLLAGCSSSPQAVSATGTPSAGPTASASVTPDASPSASVTPTADAFACPPWTDDPDSAASQIGPNRFAGACLGMTFDQATANGTALTGEAQCPWSANAVADDSLGYYVIALKSGDGATDAIYMFILRWFSDPATAAGYDLPATPEGITIGSTRDATLAAYPTATEISFDDMARGPRKQIVVPTGPDITYNFDITDGVVSEISWGTGLSAGGPNGDLCAL